MPADLPLDHIGELSAWLAAANIDSLVIAHSPGAEPLGQIGVQVNFHVVSPPYRRLCWRVLRQRHPQSR